MTPEFSHRVALAEIAAKHRISITASEDQRAALATRLGIVRIDGLTATAEIVARAAGIEAIGIVAAQVVQSCVASGEPVEQKIDEPFQVVFVAPGSISGEEIELSADELDQIEHDGQAIDLGEAAAQTLALALDPFPRAPNADAVLGEAGVIAEGEEAIGPFAALKGLK